MRILLPLTILALTACGDDGPVADDLKPMPPVEVTQAPTADWSDLQPAVGQRPAESGMLTKGPIVTDLHSLTGPDAIRFRSILNEKGGPLTRVGDLLVTVSPPGDDAIYLIIDPEQLALEAGRKANGQWVIQRTAGAEIERPITVQALFEN